MREARNLQNHRQVTGETRTEYDLRISEERRKRCGERIEAMQLASGDRIDYGYLEANGRYRLWAKDCRVAEEPFITSNNHVRIILPERPGRKSILPEKKATVSPFSLRKRVRVPAGKV